MFTCVNRYRVELDKVDDFRRYARVWVRLVRKYGGTHHGFFVPPDKGDIVPSAAFSFPGLGRTAPDDVAFAMFSFPNVDAYENYRMAVAKDEDCKDATAKFDASPCFSEYERSFLVPIFE